MTFSISGSKERDFWLINDNKDWAIVPSNKIKGFDQDVPIRLQVGNLSWGQKHIEKRHGHWLKKLGKSLPQVLYEKLGQSGQVFSTEDNSKIKITMRLAPGALLVLRYVSKGNFFTVVSLYNKNGPIDGENIGRYVSTFRVQN